MDDAEFDLWLETELWMEHGGDPNQPANRPTENFCNVVVTLQDGRVYALNVWTFDFIPLARLDWPYAYEATKQPPLAPYLLPPDLLVERLDRDTLHGIIKTMLVRGEMKPEWLSEPHADIKDMCAPEAEWEKIYPLLQTENADPLLMWIDAQLAENSDSGGYFQTLAEQAATNAIRIQDVQKTAEGWAEAACKLYDWLADQSANQSSAFSFMQSAMLVRAGQIQAYGHQDGHVVRDRNLLLNWFFKQVHSTPEQTLALSVDAKTALSNSEPPFTEQTVDQLRYLRRLRNALIPLKYCATSFEDHAELQKWLSLRAELP